ncbi:MAG: hypothetical protein ACRDZU_05195 [Acidimicrobiales bacterium]
MFHFGNITVVLVVSVVVFGSTLAGIAVGRRVGDRPGLRDSTAAAQTALLGFIALLLTFGLTMAVGRYENRRAVVAQEANAIGTTYLRAQTLAEPTRTDSVALLERYADLRLALSRAVPDSPAFERARTESGVVQRDLWRLADEALDAAPTDSAPRLYVESLNEMIDMHTTRLAALRDVIPSPVVYVQLVGSAAALGVLALYLGLVGRSAATAVLAATLVSVILLVVIDLDRPVRGFITVPATALEDLRSSMDEGPAAS